MKCRENGERREGMSNFTFNEKFLATECMTLLAKIYDNPKTKENSTLIGYLQGYVRGVSQGILDKHS